MEVTTQIGTISAEALCQLLLQRRNTQPRFRWAATQSDAEKILKAAYMAEVMCRQMQFVNDSKIDKYITKAAASLIREKARLGIMLCGTPGNGKTTLLNAIRNATAQLREWQMVEGAEPVAIEIIDARELAEASKDEQMKHGYKTRNMIAIEDMGKESAEVLNYGNAINPVMEIIEARYAKQKYTLITTNLTAGQIREKYGDRIADRFNEMLDVIVFEDGSYRRQR